MDRSATNRVAVVSRHIAVTASSCSSSASPPWPSKLFEQCGYEYSGKPDEPQVIYLKHEHIGYIIINRPHRLNACTYYAYGKIGEYLRDVDADPNLRVAIISAVGERGFCAGSDIKDNYDAKFKKEAKGEKVKLEGLEEGQTSIGWHYGKVKKPIIAAINGHANGGGCELAIAADIRVAIDTAQFGFGEVRLGWLPGGGGTQRIPRMLPKGRALAMLITGNRISAEEGHRLGLVDYMVKSYEELLATSESLAREICLSAPLAVQAIKKVALEGLDMPLDDGLALEARVQRKLMATKDAREGADAFAKKRKPNWRGE